MSSPFNWYQYMSETGSEIAPAHLFRHVERSISPNFILGHTIEVEISQDPLLNQFLSTEKAVWPCEVLLSNDLALYLRWCYPYESKGSESLSEASSILADYFENFGHQFGVDEIIDSPFWLLLNEDTWGRIHPIGWAHSAGIPWMPPQKKMVSEQLKVQPAKQEMLITSDWGKSVARRSVPRIFFLHQATCFHKLLQVGGYLECQLLSDPTCVWPVKILRNRGGRITLCWMGVDAYIDTLRNEIRCSKKFQMKSGESPIFTIFFLNTRIHQLGWGLSRGYTYKPPSGCTMLDSFKLDDEFQDSFTRGFPKMQNTPNYGFVLPEQFTFPHEPPKHNLHVGLKLEAFCDSIKCGLCPATVIKIISPRYFVVEIDAITRTDSPTAIPKVTFVANMSMPQIMPPNLGQFYGFQLVPPTGWPSDQPFTWSAYHSYLSNRSKNDPSSFPSSELDSIHSLTKYLSIPVHRFFFSNSLKQKTLSSSASDSCLSIQNLQSSSSSLSGGKTDQAKLDLPGISAPKNPSLELGASTLKDFFVGMKVEMALPPSLWNCFSHAVGKTASVEFHEPPTCSATIIRAQAGLIWLLPDLYADWSERANTQRPFDRPVMLECSSTEIYPLGWSKANGYPFIPPMPYVHSPTKNAPLPPMWQCPSQPRQSAILTSGTVDISGIYKESEYCPPVYINASCYTGPYICKSSLDALASQYGPGPMVRTLHYLLTRLVGAAYKPVKVLRLLEADWATALAHAAAAAAAASAGSSLHPPSRSSRKEEETLMETAEQRHDGMQVCLVRVRCPRRGIKIEAPVEVCSKRRALDEYCRQVSLVLEGCPYLVSTRHMTPQNPCPVQCNYLIRPRTKISSFQNVAPAVANTTSSSSHLPVFDPVSTDLRFLPRGSCKKAQTVSSQLLDPTQTTPPPLYNWCPVVTAPGNSGTLTAAGTVSATVSATQSSGDGVNSSESNNGSEDGATTPRGKGSALRRSVRTTRAATKRTIKQRERKEQDRPIAPTVVVAVTSNNGITDDEVPTLSSNPMHWTSADVAAYLERTDCRELWPWLASEAVDGQAFMLLSPPEMLHSLKGLQWEAAVKLSRHVVSVKRAFLEQFCRVSPPPPPAVCLPTTSPTPHPPPSV